MSLLLTNVVLYVERILISVSVGDDEEDHQEDEVGEEFICHRLTPHLLYSRLFQR